MKPESGLTPGQQTCHFLSYSHGQSSRHDPLRTHDGWHCVYPIVKLLKQGHRPAVGHVSLSQIDWTIFWRKWPIIEHIFDQWIGNLRIWLSNSFKWNLVSSQSRVKLLWPATVKTGWSGMETCFLRATQTAVFLLLRFACTNFLQRNVPGRRIWLVLFSGQAYPIEQQRCVLAPKP